MEQQIFTPAQIANQLGVSITRLRVIATDYEAVYGPLPSSPLNARHRAWTDEALGKILKARDLVDKRQASGIRHALEMLKGGNLPAPAVPAAVPGHQLALTPEELQRLLQEAVASALAPVLTERAELLARIESLENTIKALPAPATDELLTRMERLETTLQQQPAPLAPLTTDQIQQALQQVVSPLQSKISELEAIGRQQAEKPPKKGFWGWLFSR